MFRQQKIIHESVPALRDLLTRYQWQTEPANWLATAEDKSKKFVVTVPLVGAFSSGKSSIINAIVGQPIFSTAIDPETAVPAEIMHGDTECLTGCFSDGRRIPLNREAVRENQLGMLQHGGWVEAVLPVPALAGLSHLRLVDMPGWDSGIEAHGMAIDNYAIRSLAYGVVVSTDEGSLRSSIHRALDELKVRNMPVLAIISKADKKPPNEVDAVVAQVEQEITTAMGHPPYKSVKVSARKHEVSELVAALTELEGQAEPLFAQNVASPFTQQLQSLHRHLGTLLNSDDLDSEKIKAECEKLAADMQVFETRLNDETNQLDARVQPVLGHIMQQLESRLQSQLNTLVDQATNGGDLQGSIGSTARLVVTEGMRDEFNPEIERYLGRVAEGLPSNFSPEISGNFKLADGTNKPGTSPMVATPLVALALPAVMAFVPGLNIIGPVVLGIVALMEKLFKNKSQQKIEASRQEESARRKVLTDIIPSAVNQVKTALQPQLHQHIAQAKKKIADDVRAQQASHQAALNELQRQLEKGQAAFAQACAQYKTDQAFLQTLIKQLELS